jgi:hypothetical protein
MVSGPVLRLLYSLIFAGELVQHGQPLRGLLTPIPLRECHYTLAGRSQNLSDARGFAFNGLALSRFVVAVLRLPFNSSKSFKEQSANRGQIYFDVFGSTGLHGIISSIGPSPRTVIRKEVRPNIAIL